MNTHMKAAYKHWKTEDDKEMAVRTQNEELGFYPADEPYKMKEGLTTHGNRAGCITHARSAGISDPPIQARCGLARSSREQIDEYDSVTWESDSKVILMFSFARYNAFRLLAPTIVCVLNTVHIYW